MKGWRQEFWSRVTKGEKSSLRGKWQNAISGKQLDSVQEETNVASASEVIVDRKHNRPFPLQKRRHGLTEENLERFWSQERKSFWKKGPESTQYFSSKESARILRVIFGILPYVLITSLNRNANMATNVDSDTLRLICSPTKRRRKVV